MCLNCVIGVKEDRETKVSQTISSSKELHMSLKTKENLVQSTKVSLKCQGEKSSSLSLACSKANF